MLIDCHVHSKKYSACSHTDPDTLCLLARERGLDGLVATEHHAVWPAKLLDRLREQYAPLRIYSGVEITTTEGYDVVCLGPPDSLQVRPFMSFFKLLQKLAPVRNEVFLFVAHPFRYSDRYPSALQDMLSEVDGVEVNSVNILRAGYYRDNGLFIPRSHALYRRAWSDWNLTPLYNTDSHHPDSVGVLANKVEVDEPPEDEAGLADLLRTTMPAQHQNRDQLLHFLLRAAV